MRGDDTGGGHRHERLEELLFEELRGLFRDDVSDPVLADVTVTRVVLSVDYRHARVHFALGTSEGDAAREPSRRRALDEHLRRATPFLRGRLADALDLKRAPDLTFVLDAAAESKDATS